MHTVAVLALPDVIAFDLATPVEAFGRVRLSQGRGGYRVLVCGTRPMVEAGPMRICTDSGLDELERADTVVVPGRNTADAPAPPEALDALRRAAAAGARIASICVGAFVLAEAGLLDGRRATTHWLAADLLARRYPSVEVAPDSLYVDGGPVLTSAGAAAGLDLCLHMIRADHGRAVAADASRLAVAPLHRDGGQAPFVVRNPPAFATASLETVLAWIERNAHRPLTLTELASAARMSVRTLNRRFHAETGQSPMEWVTGVRVRHAQELLETTDHGVDRVARLSGFAAPSSFRDHFRRRVGLSPHAYRRSFTGRRTAPGEADGTRQASADR
ncbi:helix-turn-helix domain-containing protein [Streptomyces sp. NPDC047002]|uniref:GlxA family transcriptional regulator n=1 Tax=Streptomyces sp. NPDC047002 TaxID=3155475 RepID=UPI003456797A